MTLPSDAGRANNLVQQFLLQAAVKGDAPFLWAKRDGHWCATSWAESRCQVASLAAGLNALGLRHGDRVLLVAENRPEWATADLAIMAAGGVTVPAYTSNTAADHAHILRDSGAVLAIVSTAKLAATLWMGAEGTACREIVTIDAPADPSIPHHRWADLIARHPAGAFAPLAGVSARRDDLACLIYTSGTGGTPRGVRQHHGAILHNVAGAADIIRQDFPLGDDRLLSVLPLSHAYEHSAGLHLPIGLGAEIAFAESLEKLAANLGEMRPTVMVVVPRLFEVLRSRIARDIEKRGKLPAWLLAQALRIDAQRRRRWRDWPVNRLIERTLRRQVRARFGGRLKALVSGGAPLDPEVARFFRALGLVILQGYGQTEAGPIIACNRPSAGVALETVGPPLPHTEIRIADDGEILVRGENVMHGYWNDAEATAAALRDGWLHTGDIGTLDAAGRVSITARKKDIIVSDKGENIAPQRVEGRLTLEPEIAQAMVAGDRQPFLVGLLVPDREWAAHAPDIQAGLQTAVDRVNARLSVTERVRRFIVADEPFTIDNGELTPSLKIRRHRLKARYGTRLEALYARQRV
jgi:long-chain acyl-CoA synthetase